VTKISNLAIRKCTNSFTTVHSWQKCYRTIYIWPKTWLRWAKISLGNL